MKVAVLERLLHERHSCRAFLPDAVPRDVQKRIFATAQRAASWGNTQPWSVVVASGAAVERFRAGMLEAADSGRSDCDFAFPDEYTPVSLERRRECGFRLYAAVGIEKGDKAGYLRQTRENFRLFGAPHVALVTSDPGLTSYGAVDVGGYVQFLLLAMHAHGVAAIAQGALASQSGLAKALLGEHPSRKVVCGVSFGYEDKSHPANTFRTTRVSVEESVRWVDV